MKFGHQSIINGFGLIMLMSCIQLTVIALSEEPPKAQLSAREMRSDLYFLQQHLTQYSASAAASPERLAHLETSIDKALTQLPLGGDRQRFAQQLLKVMAAIDDPSARIDDVKVQAYLPLKLRKLGDKWLALTQDNLPLDSEAPFITHIDGLPISLWVAATQSFLPPSLANSTSDQARYLAMIPLLRREIGLPASRYCRLTLSDEQGHSHQLSLTLTAKPPSSLSTTEQRKQASTDLQGVFTFYDLSDFKADSPIGRRLKRALQSPVTILDLRQGHGAGDELLGLLAQIFSPDIRPPQLAAWPNSLLAVARYKKGPNLRSDYLKPLGFRPPVGLSQEERLQLDLLRTQLPKEEPGFSPWQAKFWHNANLSWSHLPRPMRGKLMLLIGPECRQQCQWIAHFSKAWPDTLVVGEPTRGEFGRQQRLTLPSSGIKLRFNTTQVYDATGKALSGVPTQPDIEQPLDEIIYWENLTDLFAPATNGQTQTSTN
ncbi:S41 family peptidase [Shewanella insulae]|uniref:S41 family peptidase n=1 Tax=Shewanella insulae TaxID=2681496 RepID=UPI0024800B96|nr:S41 family peptidase [Shewanella insulae]